MTIERKEFLSLRTAANKVVTAKAGLIEGCRVLRTALLSMGAAPVAVRRDAIEALIDAVPDSVPTGDSLLYVDDATFLAAVEQLAEIEALHRRAVLIEAREIYKLCRSMLDAVDPTKAKNGVPSTSVWGDA